MLCYYETLLHLTITTLYYYYTLFSLPSPFSLPAFPPSPPPSISSLPHLLSCKHPPLLIPSISIPPLPCKHPLHLLPPVCTLSSMQAILPAIFASCKWLMQAGPSPPSSFPLQLSYLQASKQAHISSFFFIYSPHPLSPRPTQCKQASRQAVVSPFCLLSLTL